MVYIKSGYELGAVSIHNQPGFQISAGQSREPQTYPALFAHRNRYVYRYHLQVSVSPAADFLPLFFPRT